MTTEVELAGDGDLFRRLIDAAPDAMVIADEGGSIVFVNVQTEKIFGWLREELIGQPIETLIPERFRSSHVGHRTRYIHRPQARPMGSGLELFGRRRDGSELPVEVSLSPLDIERGRLVCAAIRDISERKRMEAAARRAARNLLNAVESFQGAFALFDPDDALVMCNSAYRVLFGGAVRGEIVGRLHSEIVEANVAAALFELEEPGPEFRERWRAYHAAPNGTLHVRLKDGRTMRLIDRLTSDGGRVNTTWDISADVKREDELREARSLAEAASEAKTEFLSSMSHELRTPLNAILGFAQLLERDKKSPLSERQLDRLEHVVKGGEHLLRLIDEVLDLSRIEAGRLTISLEPVNIHEVLEQVKSALDPIAARADVRLVIEPLAARFTDVVADRTRFAQILMNYGSNAIKYGRKGGTAWFGATPRGEMVRVSVRDDGVGIPLDKQDKIFQPFQRAGQETGPIEGTGIGLTISKRIAEMMGGRVGFTSTPGQGSEFFVELSVHAASKAAAQEADRVEPDERIAVPATGVKGRLVLYVEDNPSNIAFMQDFIADLDDVELMTAPTAELGLELARARPPDVVIMDINLPGMSGLEAVRKLRQWPETRDIPVVGLSAAAMIRDAQRIQGAGFHRYLTKPVKVDDLATVLDELLTTQQ